MMGYHSTISKENLLLCALFIHDKSFLFKADGLYKARYEGSRVVR